MAEMNWLDYIRTEKKKPFDKVAILCPFPTDVIFKDGFDQDVMKNLLTVDTNVETFPQFSSDPETIVKQIVGYAVLMSRVGLYKRELNMNYGMMASTLGELLSKQCAKETDLFECNKLIGQIRDYATSIVNRERREEELMDSQRIEDEIKGLEEFSDDGNTHH